MMAWDEGQTLDAQWEHARDMAGRLHPHWTSGTSYAGFAAALVRESPQLVDGISHIPGTQYCVPGMLRLSSTCSGFVMRWLSSGRILSCSLFR